MSTLYMPAPGLGNVGSYQVSGRPYITGGLVPTGSQDGVHIVFPYVSKAFTVFNIGAGVFEVYFASKEDTTVFEGFHSLPVEVSGSRVFNCKAKHIYLSTRDPEESAECMYAIYAELTGIAEDYILTGSGISG